MWNVRYDVVQITVALSKKFCNKTIIKNPPHLHRVATLPCEILMSEKQRALYAGAVSCWNMNSPETCFYESFCQFFGVADWSYQCYFIYVVKITLGLTARKDSVGLLSGLRSSRDSLQIDAALFAFADWCESVSVAAAAGPHELFATTRQRVIEICWDVLIAWPRVAGQVT